MKLQVITINTFTKNGKGGNPAGVVLDTGNISRRQMQKAAKLVDYSETAFVQTSRTADFYVRFFTRTTEIPTCGQATIATYTALLKKDFIEPGEYTQEIQTGIVKVSVSDNKRITMDQNAPKFKKRVSAELLSLILQIPSTWISKTKLIPQIISTGLNDLLIPIDTRKHLFAVVADDKKISQLEEKLELDSLHFFTFDTIEKASITNSRNFDPLHGIHEENATGSAHGALACYLLHNKKITQKQAKKGLLFEQGYSMDNPSEIFAMLDIQAKEITRVRVGGFATITGQKEISL